MELEIWGSEHRGMGPEHEVCVNGTGDVGRNIRAGTYRGIGLEATDVSGRNIQRGRTGTNRGVGLEPTMMWGWNLQHVHCLFLSKWNDNACTCNWLKGGKT